MSVSTEPFSPVESLTEALIDANDQLLALYDMATFHTDILDEHQSVDQILGRARGLLGADTLTLVPHDESGPTGHAIQGTEVRVSDPSGAESSLIATRAARAFTTGDAKLLTAVAHLAVRARHTARMHAAAVEQAIVAHDHSVASELVQQALTAERPEIPGAHLFARSDPARTAGGDLYAFSMIDGVLHFVVGDVSGKGLPAALMMTHVVNTASRSFADCGHLGPAAVLGDIDRWVHDALSDASMFVTLLAGRFDPTTRVLSLANAGHSPVALVHDSNLRPIAASRPPIGVLPGLDCEQIDLAVFAGDRFVAASDGITEQHNASGDMFGDDRLDALLVQPANHLADLGNGIFEAVECFGSGVAQGDDRTMFMIEFGEPA